MGKPRLSKPILEFLESRLYPRADRCDPGTIGCPFRKSLAARTRCPGACRCVMEIAPVWQATTMRSSALSTLPGLPAPSVTRLPRIFRLPDFHGVQAPGWGERPRQWLWTWSADSVQWIRQSSRKIFGAAVASKLFCGRSCTHPVAIRRVVSRTACAPSFASRSCRLPAVSFGGTVVGH